MIQLIFDPDGPNYLLIDTVAKLNSKWLPSTDFVFKIPSYFSLAASNFQLIDSADSLPELISKYPELFI